MQLLLVGTRGNLTVRIRRLHVSVGSTDAARTALLYGVILQIGYAFFTWIETSFAHHRKSKDIEIVPDYLHDSTTLSLDIECTMSLFRFILLVVRMLEPDRLPELEDQ